MNKMVSYQLMTLGLSSLSFGLFLHFITRHLSHADDRFIHRSTCFIIWFYDVWSFCFSAANDFAENSENIQSNVSIALQYNRFYCCIPVLCYQ